MATSPYLLRLYFHSLNSYHCFKCQRCRIIEYLVIVPIWISLAQPVIPIRVRQRIVQVKRAAHKQAIIAIAAEPRKRAAVKAYSKTPKYLLYRYIGLCGGSLPRSPYAATLLKVARKSSPARKTNPSQTAQRSR
jgi:hypothetical protein